MEYRHYYCTPKPAPDGNSFYGKVSGIRNAAMLNASTITDFEEEFHRYVDEYLREQEEKKARRSVRALIWAIVLFALFGAMVATCPDKNKHIEQITNLTTSLLNERMDEESSGAAFLGVLLGNKLIEAYIENSLYIDNYVLFSIGKISFEGEEKAISFGIFNHVFTRSREQIRKEMAEQY